MDEQEDSQQFFRDLGASAEQIVQEVRGFEENYYSFIQGAMAAVAIVADFAKRMQSCVEQQFVAAYEFSREFSQAKDMQDFIRIHARYVQKSFQSATAQMADLTKHYASGIK